MDTTPSRTSVLQALDAIKDPKTGQGLSAAGLVRGLILREGRAGFMLEVAAADTALYAPVRDAAQAALAALPGVKQAQVVLTTEDTAPSSTNAEPAPRKAAVAPDPKAELRPAPAATRPDHVKRIIAVASAKGGVGKSTVAANLACAFARLGLNVGLMDADIYGPSMPTMMGVSGQPRMTADKKMIPAEAHGVKVTSIGLIVEADSAMIWRGPMASSAVVQLINEVAWASDEAPMDVLVLDLPPGTGDILLTLSQKIAMDGAVIVSTPQAVALADVRRGAAMFKKVGVAVLGVIENMAYFPDPTTGAPIEIFGRGGAKAMAAEIGLAFLGELPIDIALRQGGDTGAPIVASAPDSATAQAFMAMAKALTAAR
jgi:ATP-binding protein involved in chromosome partitioning